MMSLTSDVTARTGRAESRRRAGKPSGPLIPKKMTQNNTHEFLIVAIGASAGGLEALEQFFRKMPADAPMAFVVVQHLSPDHESALPQLLAKYTSMPVEQVQENTKAAPGRVYIIPPNATLTITEGMLRCAPPAEPRGQRTPIDSFFSSLAQDRGEECRLHHALGHGHRRHARPEGHQGIWRHGHGPDTRIRPI